MGQVLTKQQGHEEHAYFHHRMTSCFIQSLRFQFRYKTSNQAKTGKDHKYLFWSNQFINKDIEFKKRKSSYEEYLWHYDLQPYWENRLSDIFPPWWIFQLGNYKDFHAYSCNRFTKNPRRVGVSIRPFCFQNIRPGSYSTIHHWVSLTNLWISKLGTILANF